MRLIYKVLAILLVIIPVSTIASDHSNRTTDIGSEESNVEAILGKQIEVPQGSEVFDQIFDDGSNLYLIRSQVEKKRSGNQDKRIFYIENFASTMDHIGSVEIKLPEDKVQGEFKIVKVDLIDDKFFMLGVQYNEPEVRFDSYLFSFTKDGTLIKSNFMGAMDKVDWENLSKNFQLETFKDQGASYLLYSEITKPVDDETQRMNILLIDANMDKEWSKIINFPYDYLEYHVSGINITRKDILFIAIRAEPKYIYMDPQYKYIFYNQLKDETISYNFKLEDKLIQNMTLKECNADGYYYTFGFYKNIESKYDFDGLFYYLFDSKSHKLLNRVVQEFTPEVLEGVKSKGVIDPLIKLGQLEQKKLYITDEKDVVFISEINLMEFLTNMDDVGGTTTIKKLYHSEDIIIMTFANTGELKWSKVLTKNQEMLERGSLISHFSYIDKNNLYIVYNDNPKNLDIKDPKKIKGSKAKFAPIVAKIDLRSNDTFSKSLVSNMSNQNKNRLLFRPNHCYGKSNELIVFGDDQNFGLAKISLEK